VQINVQSNILSRIELAILREEDIFIVRRKARDLAKERGFDSFAVAALTTACSELARNVFVHGGGGGAVIEELDGDGRAGIRVTFEDKGPGIPDLERVLVGGYSTARSLGLGLSGTRRLVDEFSLDSTVGRGTLVVIVKWARF
jgi:serine/threonine-protein kinase RsbT